MLVGIALLFEVLGWMLRGQSFLFNPQRLLIIILQVSIIGLLAIGVTQVIITGGIDLSSGSVVALSAMVAASLAQSSDAGIRAVYPALTDLPAFIPIVAGLAVGALAGLVNGSLIAYRRHPGLHRHARHDGDRPRSRALLHRGPAGQHADRRIHLHRSGAMPVLIFVADRDHLPCGLRYTNTASTPMPSAATCRRPASPASMSSGTC